jgi:hypothetical protein
MSIVVSILLIVSGVALSVVSGLYLKYKTVPKP